MAEEAFSKVLKQSATKVANSAPAIIASLKKTRTGSSFKPQPLGETMKINEIKRRVRRGDYKLTIHARLRMAERFITPNDLVDLILNDDIIEEYPDRKPCPVVLILGLASGRPCHAAIACCQDRLRVVTVYWPDEECWIDCATRIR